MATETTGSGSSGTSEAPAQEAADTGTSVKDILVENAGSALMLSGAAGDVPGDAPAEDAGTAAPSGQQPDALAVQDVLPPAAGEGADLDTLGAYLSFETIGGDTVVTLDAGGTGGAAAVTLLTLEGITGVTLRQLLNAGDIIS